MRILVTGGAGYLGSVLLPKLLVRGHIVRILDLGYFGLDHLRTLRPRVEIIREDIRRATTDNRFCMDLLNATDCLIHLAAISNDPSAELNPELTEEVNLTATLALARAAREKRVRFLFSSSCSVYGQAGGEVEERGPVNPLTVYAVSKAKAERALEDLSDGAWSPLILRNGTLFGYSPRMRFDLVINIFSLHASLYNEIKVFGDGRQWRPFLHVADCARAFVFFAEKMGQRHLYYNIAHENLRVIDVAGILKGINPQLRIAHLRTSDGDERDYRVSLGRMHEEGFQTRLGVGMGAEEMVEAIVSGAIPDPESVYYRNAKWLQELTHIGSKDHREVVKLMETLAQVRSSGRA